jgi:ATP-binding cassette subfamily F protein 3
MEEAPEAPVAALRAMRLGFPPAPRSGRVVVELCDAGFAYGSNVVYRDLNLSIERGQKVALVGPNGAGKTTLLKLLAGALTPANGERIYGHNVTVGYFAQHQIEALDPSLRVIEELARALPPRSTVRERDLLGKFLFSGDDIDKPVRVLSGGERSRLAMAKMLVSPFNLLCLDEPTNHLDVQSRDVLEDALTEYDGAMVLITHDRHLIRSVATRIVEVVDGVARSFEGDYEYYLSKVSDEVAAPAARADKPPSAKSAKRKEAAIQAALRQARSRVQASIRRVEAELERTHKEMETLGALLADPEFYKSAEGVAEAVNDYERLQDRVGELEAEWERLTADV